MLIPSKYQEKSIELTSLSRRVNANSQRFASRTTWRIKLIKKGEC